MITQAKAIEDEVLSLASSIKRNMVDPAGRRMETLEQRVSAAEKSIIYLTRALIAASAALSAALVAVIYYLSL
ncbi:MAG: hypothetical protein ACYC4H_13355 [Desulfocucumaceae bacterium]